MNKLKKLFCLLITTLLFLTFSVCVFASNGTSEDAIKIEVATDKAEYKVLGIAEITATITNTGTEPIENVTAQVVFNDLAPVKNSETSKSVEMLKAGESISFTYNATLNKNEHDLNIFQKIFLWFVRLFNGGYTATNNIIDVVTEDATDITFGKFTAKNVIQVGYSSINNDNEKNEPFTFTEEELTTMEIVNTKITELTHSDEFKEYSVSERKSKIDKILDELVENDLIVESSIVFNDEYNQFYFEYDTGIGYYIDIDEYEDHAGENATLTEDTQLFNLTRNVANKSSNNSDSLGNNAVYIYGADNTDYNRVKTHVEQLNKLGIKTDLYSYLTANDYKTILLNYDLITIIEHGMEFWDDNRLALSLKEKQTTEKNKSLYADDLAKKRILIENGHYCITPEFFSHYYQNKLDGSFVNLISCQSMGRNGRENHRFSEAFAQCGVSAVLGFHNDVNYRYGLDFSRYYTMQLLFSKTSKEAFEISKEQIGKDFVDFVNKNIDKATEGLKNEAKEVEKNGTVCYPIITSHYANPFDFGTFTITVKDKFTGEFAKNVSGKIFWIEATEELYSNNPNSHFEYTIVTDEKGMLSDKLATGYYGCIFNDDAYETEYIIFSIEKDTETVLVEPVYLTPKSYLMGTVIDKETNTPVEDASVLLQKIDEAGLIVGEYTCSTDNNGKFEISVPVGNYTYTINKLDMTNELYEDATGTVTVNKADGNILDTVYLSPKDTDSGETERTVIDSGNCGADGDNVTWTLYEDGEIVISGSGEMKDYVKDSGISNSPFTEPTAKYITIKDGVTSIGSYAFDSAGYCDNNITKVIIPNSVTSIGEFAFYGCSNLETINIPDNVTSIGKSAFSGCSNLASITIPDGVTIIKEKTFYHCSNLTEIIIPDSVTTIEYMSFIDCTNLKSVKFGSGLEIIGTQAFQSCEKLSEIILPDSLKEIGSSAFVRCYCLEYAQIGDNVSNIGGGAFNDCTSLEFITIPESLLTIGKSAFEDCNNLKNV